MGLFRPYDRDEKDPSWSSDGSPSKTEDATPSAPGKKGPTPTRREAEAARLERLHPTLSKKEMKQREREQELRGRARGYELIEQTPERVLLRNYIDSKWTFCEFVWPILLLLLALGLVGARFPQVLPISTFLAWGTFIGMVLDVAINWRGFKKVLAKRHPNASTKGLFSYLWSRMLSPRRFRRPPAAINRGDAY